MMNNVIYNEDLLQLIVSYARLYGKHLLDTCGGLYKFMDKIKLNVHTRIVDDNEYDKYKKVDFKNINYVFFRNSMQYEIVRMELRSPIVFVFGITLHELRLMSGLLHTKSISLVSKNDKITKKQIFKIIDSGTYRYVFFNTTGLNDDFTKPGYKIFNIGRHANLLCYDTVHKRMYIGSDRNDYGEIVLKPGFRIVGDYRRLENVFYERIAKTSRGFNNMALSGHWVDELQIPCQALSTSTEHMHVRTIYTTISDDEITIGKNISYSNIVFTMCSYQDFTNITIDNDCEYSFALVNTGGLRYFSDGVNLLVHSDHNNLVLVNSTKYVPTNYCNIGAYHINHLDYTITKDNCKEIIGKYIYDGYNKIIHDAIYRGYNDIYAYNWCGRNISVRDITTGTYRLYLTNDTPYSQFIITVEETEIYDVLEISLVCLDDCNDASIVIVTSKNSTDIAKVHVIYRNINKLFITINGTTIENPNSITNSEVTIIPE